LRTLFYTIENEELKESFNIKDDVPLTDEFNTFESYCDENRSKTLKMIDNSSKTLFKTFEYLSPKVFWSIVISSIALVTLLFYFLPKVLLGFVFLSIALYIVNKKWFKRISNKILEIVMKRITKYYLKYVNQKYLDSGKMEQE